MPPNPQIEPVPRATPLPASRLRSPGPATTDVVTWIGRAAMGLLAVGVGTCLWAALRPLAQAELGAEVPIPQPLTTPAAPADVEGRQSTLAALNKENIFSVERRPWSRQAMAAADQEAGKGAGAPPAAPTKAAPPNAVTQMVDGKPIGVTPEKGMPEELKKALAAVELKGVFVTPEGDPVAMIGFVHASNRAASMPYKAGEEFKDEQNPQQPWKVVAVDYQGSRAILARAGHNVELALYRSKAPDGPAAAATLAAPTEAKPAGVTVVSSSRDEVTAQLRAAKVPEDQIAALMAKLDEPDSPEARAIQAELARQAATAKPNAGGDASGRTPPPGMESVLKMMAEQAKSPPPPAASDGSGTPQEKPKRGRRRGDPGPAPSQQPGGSGGSSGSSG